MSAFLTHVSTVAAVLALSFSHVIASPQNNLQPFQFNLSAGLQHQIQLVKSTILPKSPELPNGADADFGISLDLLSAWKERWIDPSQFDWQTEEDNLNA